MNNIKFKKLVNANSYNNELYKEQVNKKVSHSLDYGQGGELAILRKSLTLLVNMMKTLHPNLDFSQFDELLKYNGDVEQIKLDTKEELK